MNKPVSDLPHPKMLNQRSRKVLRAQLRDVQIELDHDDGLGAGFAKPPTTFLQGA